MNLNDIESLVSQQNEKQRIYSLLSRHDTYALAYNALQTCLKEATPRFIDLKSDGYLRTTGHGYGLWALARTKLFIRCTGNHYVSWCGRHHLFLSPTDNFHNSISISLKHRRY